MTAAPASVRTLGKQALAGALVLSLWFAPVPAGLTREAWHLFAVFAAALFSPQWPLASIFAVAVVLGATAIGWNGVYLGEVARLAPPGLAGQATGGCLFFTFVGVVVIPFLFGWLQRVTGSYAACFAAAGAVCIVVAVLLAIARPARTSMQ